MPDWEGGQTPNGALYVRLAEERAQLEEPEVQAWLAAHAAALQLPRQKPFPLTERSLAFWLRMHYSCLVDADFLDTERFMDGARAQARGGYRPLAELAERFFAQLAELAANYDTSWVLSTATQPTLPGFQPPATAFSSIVYRLSRNPPGAGREGRPG